MMNSFQKWADDYARAFGWIVTLKGNWVELHKDGETHECMSVEGVQTICKASSSNTDYRNWSIEQFAKHYVETLSKAPNGLGQHISDIFGQSHFIIIAASRMYPTADVQKAINDAVRKAKI